MRSTVRVACQVDPEVLTPRRHRWCYRDSRPTTWQHRAPARLAVTTHVSRDRDLRLHIWFTPNRAPGAGVFGARGYLGRSSSPRRRNLFRTAEAMTLPLRMALSAGGVPRRRRQRQAPLRHIDVVARRSSRSGMRTCVRGRGSPRSAPPHPAAGRVASDEVASKARDIRRSSCNGPGAVPLAAVFRREPMALRAKDPGN